MNYGYARCSTNESRQDIDRQVRELKAAGAEEIFLEYEHGDAAVKKQQQTLLTRHRRAIPLSRWKFPALPEAPSNFVRLSKLSTPSICGW